MSRQRILVAWELGLNFGHLGRLLPVVAKLRAHGHHVHMVLRDLSAARRIIADTQVTLAQAPCLARAIAMRRPIASYAGILLTQGWGDPVVLSQLVSAWRIHIANFKPDAVLCDHSPTARLTTHLMNTPTILVGNGFELPPTTVPLPPFPGYSWATDAEARREEKAALDCANTVVARHGGVELDSLSRLFATASRAFATLPELDHYGPRADANYIGMLGSSDTKPIVDWPDTSGKRVYAYLSTAAPAIDNLIAGLHDCDARVLCVLPDASDTSRWPTSPRMRMESHPVSLAPLTATADLCFTYAAEGTLTAFLRAGVPQLMVPDSAERQLIARRVEDLGAGLVLRGPVTRQSVALLLKQMLDQSSFQHHAAAFAARHSAITPEQTTDRLVEQIEEIALRK